VAELRLKNDVSIFAHLTVTFQLSICIVEIEGLSWNILSLLLKYIEPFVTELQPKHYFGIISSLTLAFDLSISKM